MSRVCFAWLRTQRSLDSAVILKSQQDKERLARATARKDASALMSRQRKRSAVGKSELAAMTAEAHEDAEQAAQELVGIVVQVMRADWFFWACSPLVQLARVAVCS